MRNTNMHALNTWLILFSLSLGLLTLPASAEELASNASKPKSIFFDSSSEDNFLSPDQAFQVEIQANDVAHVVANFKVAQGYYLYKQRVKFSITNPALGDIARIDLPNGEIKNDPNFGQQEVYHHDFTANILLNHANNPKIKVIYQGCSEKGLCYAPQTKTFQLQVSNDNRVNNQQAKINNNDDQTTQALKSGKLWLVISLFFIAGLLLSLTPCVLPMIPILSSMIINNQRQQAQPSKLQAFALSLSYVLGMALSYTLAGIFAGLSGQLISQALQNAWALSATAIVFIGLAFSMFGFYELRLPSSFESKVLSASQQLKGGAFLGVFLMGILSALIVSPCVAAPLAGALIYIGQTHNVLLGGLGLFSLAIGMGVPLLIIGASAGSLLPKTGKWMTLVRNLLGVFMLLMAAYIVWPILPDTIKTPINQIVGQETSLPFKRVKSVSELEANLKSAQGKIVMLDFYADWCTACKEMEKLTFSQTSVRVALKDVILLQADVTENNLEDQTLLKRFGLFGPPGIVFFNTHGQEIPSHIIGYKNTDEFLTILEQIKK